MAEVILKASHGDEKLFLALEQGSGKFKEHTNVVLNPKLKNRARQWLLTEYPLLTLLDCAPAKTSVVAESSQNKEKYDEDLKEFLSSSLSKVDVSKTKKYSTKLKSYAQALGIEIKHAEKSKEKGKNTKPVVQKNHHNEIQNSLQNQIKSLETQLQMMSDLIKNICTIIMTDSDKKSQILLSLKDIQNQQQNTNPQYTNEKEHQQNNQAKDIENSEPQVEIPVQEKENTVKSRNNNKVRKNSPCLNADQELSGFYQSANAWNSEKEKKKLKSTGTLSTQNE